MKTTTIRKSIMVRSVLILVLAFQFSACSGQVKEHETPAQPMVFLQNTTFPQIHTNLNGMVRDFVRTMYQDRAGNFWFGTNGDGIIRYDGNTLEKMTIDGLDSKFRVLDIVADKAGNLWFGSSEGLIKYNGRAFTTFSKHEGAEKEEIWTVAIDKNGMIWTGGSQGVHQFDGEKFTPFSLPDAKVENPIYMLGKGVVFKIIEDRNGTLWFAADGNGIFTYKNGEFTHLTAQNVLSDNHVADIFEDSRGNIWMGTFYGGMSRFDGETYTHFTKDGTIAGEEAYNLYEDSQGNIWFTAEGYGVYRYDGKGFKQFTTEDGLTSNVTLSILEDNKGQLWFGSWQGLCIFDGEKFVNARDKEPWTK